MSEAATVSQSETDISKRNLQPEMSEEELQANAGRELNPDRALSMAHASKVHEEEVVKATSEAMELAERLNPSLTDINRALGRAATARAGADRDTQISGQAYDMTMALNRGQTPPNSAQVSHSQN